MYSIWGGHLLAGLGHLSNSNSNCFSPLDIPLQGDTTQATTSIAVGHCGGLGKALDSSDMSNMAEFEVDTDEFKTIQDGFETKATIGDLCFIFF
jgi:hypothetical protein